MMLKCNSKLFSFRVDNFSSSLDGVLNVIDRQTKVAKGTIKNFFNFKICTIFLKLPNRQKKTKL